MLTFELQIKIWRLVYIGFWIAMYCYSSEINGFLDLIWIEMKKSDIFRHDSFEPLLASFSFGVWIWVFYLLDIYDIVPEKYHISKRNKDKCMRAHHNGNSPRAFFAYLGPILTFDFLFPRRHLPESSIHLDELILSVTLSIFLYDFIMFFPHLAMHKVKNLCNIHQNHHSVSPLVSTEVIHHSFADGAMQVLANVISLKLLKIHPMARALHNVLITYLLTELHAGYDFPWMLHNIIPFNILGGPRKHELHHRIGKSDFQQFFNYLDFIFGTYGVNH